MSTTSPSSGLPWRRFALLLLTTAQFVIVLDGSIVNVALPSIQRSLHFSPVGLSWVANGYLLSFGGLLLFGGRLADVVGRRRVFSFGLVAFGLFSLLCGLSTSAGELVAFRVCQGACGALVAPSALALILVTFTEPHERGRAFGAYGAASGAAGAAGVLFGGLLTQHASWQWVFLINTPITIFAALVARRTVPESKAGTRGVRDLDAVGAVLGTGGVGLLVYAFVQTDTHGWSSARTLGLIAGAVVVLVGFVVIELRLRAPVLDPRLLANRSVAVGNIIGLAVGASVLASMFYFLSLFMQLVLGYSAQTTGLAFLPMAVAIAVGSRLGARLLPASGPRPVLIAGTGMIAASAAWMSTFATTTGYGVIVAPTLIAGFGLGMCVLGVNGAATQGVSPRVAGQVGAVVTSAQRVGGALGLAVLASVTAALTARDLRHGVGQALALTKGFDRGFTLEAVIMATAFVLALVAIRPARTARAAASVAPAAAG